jgi:hypothetical protein
MHQVPPLLEKDISITFLCHYNLIGDSRTVKYYYDLVELPQYFDLAQDCIFFIPMHCHHVKLIV